MRCSIRYLTHVVSLISDWCHTVSSKFFDTQVSSESTKELLLPRHACCDPSHLSSIENPSRSTCGHPTQDTSHLSYGLFVLLALRRLFLFTTSGSGPGELCGFMVFRHAPPPILRKRSGNNSDLFYKYCGKELKLSHTGAIKQSLDLLLV